MDGRKENEKYCNSHCACAPRVKRVTHVQKGGGWAKKMATGSVSKCQYANVPKGQGTLALLEPSGELLHSRNNVH